MKLPRFLIMVLMGGTTVLAGISYFSTAAQKEMGQSQSVQRVEKLQIESKGSTHTFQVEIADTPVGMEIGLMFREHMELDHGMLFQMGRTDMISFWMKNTLIPLDMLFVAADGTIKKIHENATPKSLEGIGSGFPVTGVLEINGGRARALGIVVGDRVTHPYFVP